MSAQHLLQAGTVLYLATQAV